MPMKCFTCNSVYMWHGLNTYEVTWIILGWFKNRFLRVELQWLFVFFVFLKYKIKTNKTLRPNKLKGLNCWRPFFVVLILSPCALPDNLCCNVSALQPPKSPVDHTVWVGLWRPLILYFLLEKLESFWEVSSPSVYSKQTVAAVRNLKWIIFWEPEGFYQDRLTRHWVAGIAEAVMNRLVIGWINIAYTVCCLTIWIHFYKFTHHPPPSVSLSPRSPCCPLGWPGPAAVWPWQRA